MILIFKLIFFLFSSELALALFNNKLKISVNNISCIEECKNIPKFCPSPYIGFWLYTRETRDAPYQLNISEPSTITNAPFIKNKPFYLLIHGFTGSKNSTPNEQVRPVLLDRGNVNVISVDYSPLAGTLCYLTAVTNLNVVGNCTAQLLDYLVEKIQLKLENLHVIGFSLGAHASGYMSLFIKSGKLEHITGLDPANPFFATPNIDRKLEKSDAKFVDIVHTCGLKAGKIEPLGHVDFYANGGISQPGCFSLNVFDGIMCNHRRSAFYYAESIYTKKGFYGHSCLVPITNCNQSDIQIMGFHTPKTARGTYFFNTNSKDPFAQGRPKYNLALLRDLIKN